MCLGTSSSEFIFDALIFILGVENFTLQVCVLVRKLLILTLDTLIFRVIALQFSLNLMQLTEQQIAFGSNFDVSFSMRVGQCQGLLRKPLRLGAGLGKINLDTLVLMLYALKQHSKKRTLPRQSCPCGQSVVIAICGDLQRDIGGGLQFGIKLQG
ncbi:hypothetical protein DIE14_35305 [Burkholderia sp. Bp9017]|nr:hypothetical protein DIE14_35305 [Burkholderia sp. Bp9017]